MAAEASFRLFSTLAYDIACPKGHKTTLWFDKQTAETTPFTSIVGGITRCSAKDCDRDFVFGINKKTEDIDDEASTTFFAEILRKKQGEEDYLPELAAEKLRQTGYLGEDGDDENIVWLGPKTCDPSDATQAMSNFMNGDRDEVYTLNISKVSADVRLKFAAAAETDAYKFVHFDRTRMPLTLVPPPADADQSRSNSTVRGGRSGRRRDRIFERLGIKSKSKSSEEASGLSATEERRVMTTASVAPSTAQSGVVTELPDRRMTFRHELEANEPVTELPADQRASDSTQSQASGTRRTSFIPSEEALARIARRSVYTGAELRSDAASVFRRRSGHTIGERDEEDDSEERGEHESEEEDEEDDEEEEQEEDDEESNHDVSEILDSYNRASR